MKTHHLPRLALATSALLAAGQASAAILALNPTADSFVRSLNPTDARGIDREILVGVVAANDYARAVLAFDLNNPLLVGATINSVTLSFVTTTNDAGSVDVGNRTFNLHALTQSFANNTVTWNVRDTGVNWTAAGGTFNSTVLSSLTANPDTLAGGGTIGFGTTSNFTGAATGSVGGTFFLLAKIGSESGSDRGLLRLNSQNATGAANDPVLTIDYTPAAVPEPSAAAALAGLGALGLVASRRRRR